MTPLFDFSVGVANSYIAYSKPGKVKDHASHHHHGILWVTQSVCAVLELKAGVVVGQLLPF